MTLIVRVDEAEPTNRPVITGLSTEAQALDQAALWRRIEQHTVYRYGVRNVLFTVSGPGEFISPIGPVALLNSASRWVDGGWSATTLDATPLGLECLDYTYLIDCDIGALYTDDLPADVILAFQRLAEYLGAEDVMPVGASMYESDIGGEIRERTTRNAQHVAKSLMNSGAADLLRGYRRL